MCAPDTIQHWGRVKWLGYPLNVVLYAIRSWDQSSCCFTIKAFCSSSTQCLVYIEASEFYALFKQSACKVKGFDLQLLLPRSIIFPFYSK